MEPLTRLNAVLDSLPRVRFFRSARPVPAFRSLGIAGFYLAVTVTFAVGLSNGLSALVLTAVSAVCGASFYAWAFLRRALTGKENLVLLEHVWIALGASAGVLVALRVAPLPYLDAAVSGLAFFLAMGRVGCFLAGCCHGLPASVGVAYGEAHARDGFCAEWTSVRLFPVQILEGAGLVLIGVLSSALAVLAAPGTALCAWLTLYAVMRFGLEGIRADMRPHFLGLSQSRWMALAEFALGVALLEEGHLHPAAPATAAALLAAFLVFRAGVAVFGLRARALRAPHLEALREAARVDSTDAPRVAATPLGFRVGSSSGGRVVSLSSPEPGWDLAFLCALAARAFPELSPASVMATAQGVLVFELPQGVLPARARADADLGYRAMGACAHKLQAPPPAAEAGEFSPARAAYFSSGETERSARK